jgi:hypothetical protein
MPIPLIFLYYFFYATSLSVDPKCFALSHEPDGVNPGGAYPAFASSTTSTQSGP